MVTSLKRFIASESKDGLILMGITALALIWANLPQSGYNAFFHHPTLPLTHLINDGLMVFYFLLVGAELRREIATGELSSQQKRMLPGICALGGAFVPALIFYAFNHHMPTTLQGWAIPSATDIAFTLGILSLFGRQIRLPLKVFVTALAITDDIIAILIIAFFYSQTLGIAGLIASLCIVTVLFLIKDKHHWPVILWIILCLLLAWTLHSAGIHATLAGIMTAAFMPYDKSNGSILHRMEKQLLPWCSFVILPLFALANAGLNFHHLSPSDLSSPLSLGILLGLWLGKPLGILSAALLTIYFKKAKWPEHTSLRQFIAAAQLCGIGFTMSLFIGNLAFFGHHPEMIDQVRLGVLSGSLLSAITAACIILVRPHKPYKKLF